MIRIPFAKLHGAENDFLLTWADEAPVSDFPNVARSVCARNTGIGADGWMLVSRIDFGLSIRLFNSDGSEAEISGNGTRCAAAFGLWTGVVKGENIRVKTAAGLKVLRLLAREETGFRFEMDMGCPDYSRNEVRTELRVNAGVFDASILNVGNPQCAIFVENLPADWRAAAALAEADPRFPNRTNVSFVVVRDEHNIEAVFFERGAGETRSSGTGSTGAAVAAILRGKAKSPVSRAHSGGPTHRSMGGQRLPHWSGRVHRRRSLFSAAPVIGSELGSSDSWTVMPSGLAPCCHVLLGDETDAAIVFFNVIEYALTMPRLIGNEKWFGVIPVAWGFHTADVVVIARFAGAFGRKLERLLRSTPVAQRFGRSEDRRLGSSNKHSAVQWQRVRSLVTF